MSLLVIDRLHFLRLRRSPHQRRKASVPLNLDEEHIFRSYRGIDGLPWPPSNLLTFELVDGLAKNEDYATVEAYLNALPNRVDCDLIAIGKRPELHPERFRFVGFDVGYYESEFSHFSSLLHEVVFGSIEEMRAYASQLNSQLLLAEDGIAHRLIDARRLLLLNHYDLEPDGDFVPIAIYAH